MMYVVIAFVSFIIYMWIEAHRNRIIVQSLSFPTFPESFSRFRIFFISDIHRRRLSETFIRSLKGKVDLVVIGGDLTEKGVPFSRVKQNIEWLKQLGPVYFVWGNNDYEVDYHELDALLLESGVKILDNTAVIFESEQGDRIALLGVDDMNKRRDRLDLALSDAGDATFRIVVSHDPRIIQKITPEHNISLVLSGHTHGGQIRFGPFGLYEKGRLQNVNGTMLLVSNGYGTTTLPLRLGARAETHLIELEHKKG
ncbi:MULTISPECIES: metallophosphoesterase [Anoxybacillus]|uniref:Putative metallophosphoesterase n=1 Tax=Anoxybacillus ayderensis TaxID=265546 RepID=A0A0D0HL01_9BACL|nr:MULTISPECIES: metallophosphoesterase [Anoxybacillus]EPZ38457.1 calcineurin-like phosphohydrolase [Anoxybacillus ayderensis]KHF30633.1 putative metallophosphoesterase [Anoxybacillus sp. BCO1]KIP20844.1 putative metallophosphoesterase [Anoxybacillus ayderensis]NNU96641.1 metallophosphoesterase [Anoxybacillus sp. EFIL]